MRATGALSRMTASMLLSWVSLAVRDDSMAALSVPFTYVLVTVPAEPKPWTAPGNRTPERPLAPLFDLALALGLDDAQDVLGARLGHPLARRDAGDRLVLA